MLGWHISVYRLTAIDLPSVEPAAVNEAARQALLDSAASRGSRIAVWQAGLSGLDWLDRLAGSDRAIAFPGGGYPDRYFAPAGHLRPTILKGPPHARTTWHASPTDVLLPNWDGRTVIDPAAIENCEPEEWLLVEAWDES